MADHLRAVLITLHILAVVLMAAPVPEGGMSRSAWKSDTIQAEIAGWAERVGTAPDVLEAKLWEAAEEIVDVRRTLIRPFRPYYRHCGTTQSWQLFVIPQTNPARLHIDLQQDGQWTPIYIARDGEAVWQRDLLDTERMRSLLFRLSWKHYQRRYRRFGRWMARKAAAAFPDADAMRTRWFRQRTPTPRQVRKGTEKPGAFEGEQVFELGPLR